MKRLLAYLFIILGLGLTFSLNANSKTYYCVPKNISELEDTNFAKFFISKDGCVINGTINRKKYILKLMS